MTIIESWTDCDCWTCVPATTPAADTCEPRDQHDPRCRIWTTNHPCDCRERNVHQPDTSTQHDVEVNDSVAELAIRYREIDATIKQLTDARDAMKQIFRTVGIGRLTHQGRTLVEVKRPARKFNPRKAVDVIPEELHDDCSDWVITAAGVLRTRPDLYDACCTESAAAVSPL